MAKKKIEEHSEDEPNFDDPEDFVDDVSDDGMKNKKQNEIIEIIINFKMLANCN